jgi:alpha-glucosidase
MFMNKLRNQAILAITCLCFLGEASIAQTSYTLISPSKKIEMRIQTADHVRYDVLFKGKPLMNGSALSLDVDHKVLGVNAQVVKTSERTVDDVLEPVVRQKFARIREAYNELRLEMLGGYSVVFRAYDEGVAYRFETSFPQPEVKVYGEEASFNFAGNYKVYFPQEDSFQSHNERAYLPREMREILPLSMASLPAVVDADGVKVAIADSDIEEYPGLWLRGTGGNGLSATFPPYALEQQTVDDFNVKVSKAADYIAVTKGTRTYPWRLLGIAEKDGDLITNQLVWLLAKPSQLEDTSWIKPGKVSWDWWNANNLYGVDFKSGINTQTYKYYIDFASKYRIEYIMMDLGWYKLGNLMDVSPEIDMAELSRYAEQRHVGIILWAIWKTLDDQMVPALDQFQKWGIRGVKVDFMERDDQTMIGFYHRLCREAAKRHMLVDFHGGQAPATMTRTWPNLISTEGVKGNEWNKGNADANPVHNVTIPFTRMFLGPMDYTPGAMVNANRQEFHPSMERPMSLGTRCHQLGMYVVYESPLQMLADSPSNYLREPEIMEFLGPVPSTWDETRVLDAKIASYVMVARRKGSEWYIGAMTDWTARDLVVDLSFLPKGTFQIDIYQDGINAERYGSDYKKVSRDITASSKMNIHLAEGGGWVARIRPAK